jgi:hypothetical protein
VDFFDADRLAAKDLAEINFLLERVVGVLTRHQGAKISLSR